MYWTLELASYLEDAPWPATKDELIDFSIRSGAPLEVVENLQELEDDGQPYENIEGNLARLPYQRRFFLQRRRILTHYWLSCTEAYASNASATIKSSGVVTFRFL